MYTYLRIYIRSPGTDSMSASSQGPWAPFTPLGPPPWPVVLLPVTPPELLPPLPRTPTGAVTPMEILPDGPPAGNVTPIEILPNGAPAGNVTPPEITATGLPAGNVTQMLPPFPQSLRRRRPSRSPSEEATAREVRKIQKEREKEKEQEQEQ